VIDDELARAVEDLRQRLPAVAAFEYVFLLDRLSRARVNAFSLASSFLRAASQAFSETTA
jgi:hypothetical protein